METVRERCPELLRCKGLDIDLCKLTYNVCLLELGQECETYNNYLEEINGEEL